MMDFWFKPLAVSYWVNSDGSVTEWKEPSPTVRQAVWDSQKGYNATVSAEVEAIEWAQSVGPGIAVIRLTWSQWWCYTGCSGRTATMAPPSR